MNIEAREHVEKAINRLGLVLVTFTQAMHRDRTEKGQIKDLTAAREILAQANRHVVDALGVLHAPE